MPFKGETATTNSTNHCKNPTRETARRPTKTKMWSLCVAVAAAATAVELAMMPRVEASGARPGLSWCSESTIDNLRVDKSKKPDLGNIEVVVNSTYKLDVVDEVYIRQQAPCEGITQEEVVLLDGDQARLVMRDDGEIGLFWRVPDSLPIFQEVEEFCITAKRDKPAGSWTTFLAKFCFPVASLQTERDLNSCSGITCVRKCCPQEMALSQGSACAPVEDLETWEPNLASGEPGAVATPVHMLFGPPRLCDNALLYQEFSILPSGAVRLNELSVGVDGYCIDAFLERPSHPVAMVCMEKATSWSCDWKYMMLKPLLLGVSCVCLLLTWLVYVCVAKLRRSNEGSCLISLVSALFFAYVTFIFLNITANTSPRLACVVVGRLCHFFVLASFFWMNVLSFHTFMQLRSGKDARWEKPLVFRLYSLYAWCCPLLIVLVGVVLDAVEADVVRPHIDTSCWMYDVAAFWVYLYGPMLLLLLLNSGFFVGCVVILSCGRGRTTYDFCTNTHQTCSAWMYVRLFIIMGILWLMEVVTWSVFPYCSVPEWIFTIVNSLQGVYVFLVAVCFRRDLKVFHCGRPRLVQEGKHREVASTSGEASEMAANPLVPK